MVLSYVPVCGRCLMCASGRGAFCENGSRANRSGALLTGRRPFAGPGGALHHHLGVAGFSEFTVAAQESLVKIEPGFPLDKAVLFGCAVLTGVGAIVNAAKVSLGESVAVFGLGDVGLTAVMGACAVGANPVIGIDILPRKLALARQAGATHTVDASGEDPVEVVRDITSGGTTVNIGLAHHTHQLTIPASSLVAEERTLKGTHMGSSVPRRDVPRFMDMYRTGNLPVDLLHTHTLVIDDINAAFDRLADGEAVRQIVSFTTG